MTMTTWSRAGVALVVLSLATACGGSSGPPAGAPPVDPGDEMGSGSLDTTFGGGDGIVITDVAANPGAARAVVLQPDGKILVAGDVRIGPTDDIALLRYNPDGTLDPTFGGGDGIATTDLSEFEGASAVALQPDGKILVAGDARIGTTDDIVLLRYDADGTLDPDFGVGGIVITSVGSDEDVASAVALQPDGKIVVAGQVFVGTPTNFDIALLRYNPDGTLDPTFGGGDGIVITGVGSHRDTARAVALQPDDGKILVAGQARIGTTDDIALLRYHPNGDLDLDFGDNGDGIVITDVGSGSAVAFAVALQPDDGKIVVAGQAFVGIALLRYDASGTLDPDFGVGGIVITGSGPDGASAVALQPDGKILVAGEASGDIALLRYNPDGTLDPTFGGGDGIVTTDVASNVDEARAVALQPDGKIVVAGSALVGNSFDIVLLRYNP